MIQNTAKYWAGDTGLRKYSLENFKIYSNLLLSETVIQWQHLQTK